MRETNDYHSVTATLSDVDGAVGVAETHWFVGIVNHNAETTSAQKLVSMGYEAFAATQRENRIWANGKRHMINRVVIGSTIFVHCTEAQRKEIVKLPFIYRFLSDRANGKPVATIPGKQIEMLRYMLGQDDAQVEFVSHEYTLGEPVRVKRGRLINAQGTIIHLPNGKGELVISLGALGGAKCAITLSDIEPLQ